MDTKNMMRTVIFIVSLIGMLFIWSFLNYISKGNITNRGLGDFILMCFGWNKLVNIFSDIIFKK